MRGMEGLLRDTDLTFCCIPFFLDILTLSCMASIVFACELSRCSSSALYSVDLGAEKRGAFVTLAYDVSYLTPQSDTDCTFMFHLRRLVFDSGIVMAVLA